MAEEEGAAREFASPASFRLNGAARWATPCFTLAALAKNSWCEMRDTIGIRVGQIKCAKWAKPDARTQSEPNIPWIDIVGIRNRLIHAYFDVTVDVVWGTIDQDLPELTRELTRILEQAGRP